MVPEVETVRPLLLPDQDPNIPYEFSYGIFDGPSMPNKIRYVSRIGWQGCAPLNWAVWNNAFWYSRIAIFRGSGFAVREWNESGRLIEMAAPEAWEFGSQFSPPIPVVYGEGLTLVYRHTLTVGFGPPPPYDPPRQLLPLATFLSSIPYQPAPRANVFFTEVAA